MNVYFDTASLGYDKKIDMIEKVRDVVIELNHTPIGRATSDVPIMTEMSLGILDVEEWTLLCERDMNILKQADVVIFEVSNKATFGLGFLAAHALMLGKPTLFLLEENCVRGSFTTGFMHEMLTRKVYNRQNIKKIVEEFLKATAK